MNFADITQDVDEFLWNFWGVGCLSSEKKSDLVLICITCNLVPRIFGEIFAITG